MKQMLSIVFLAMATTGIRAQMLSEIFKEMKVGIGTHYGGVYVDNPYINLSNYSGVQLSFQTANIKKIHLYTELRYTQIQIENQANPLKKDDYSYPYMDYLKTVSVPIYLGYETQWYNYNSYYFRVGLSPIFIQENGQLTQLDSSVPFYYGFQLGTYYDFMNHLVGGVSFQYEAYPILYKDNAKTANFFGLQLQLSYQL